MDKNNIFNNLEQKLKNTSDELNQLRNLLDNFPNIFYFLNHETGEIIYTNERREGIELSCFKPFDEVCDCVIKDVKRSDVPITIEHINNFDIKNPKVQEVSGKLIKDEKNEPTGVLIIVNDISKYKGLNDSFTGLYNMKYINEQIFHLENLRNEKFGIIFADIDYLKLANDVFSHSFGDYLIKLFAEIMKNSFRKSDYVGRRGEKADEFIALVRKPTKKTLEDKCQEISKIIKKTSSKINYPLSVSLGYDMQETSFENSDSVIMRAEFKLYKNKSINHSNILNKFLQFYKKSIYKKVPQMWHHNKRLIKIAMDFAHKIDLAPTDKDLLFKSIMYKDIGYASLQITKDMLQKTNLSTKDLYKIQQHPNTANDIISKSPWLAGCSNIVLHHHCDWNGLGYPRISKKQIPSLSRIIRICESFEHMVYGNYYSGYEKMPVKKAIEELNLYAGIKYDSVIVNRFSKYINSLIGPALMFRLDNGLRIDIDNIYAYILPSGTGNLNFSKELEENYIIESKK
ncbi:MAG: diguanylate cyclase [Nanoarchaeota archaeon]